MIRDERIGRSSMAFENAIDNDHLIESVCAALASGMPVARVIDLHRDVTPALVDYALATFHKGVSKAAQAALVRRLAREQPYYRLARTMHRCGITRATIKSALRISRFEEVRWFHGIHDADPPTTESRMRVMHEFSASSVLVSSPVEHVRRFGRAWRMPGIQCTVTVVADDGRAMCSMLLDDGTEAHIEFRADDTLPEAAVILAHHWATGGMLPGVEALE